MSDKRLPLRIGGVMRCCVATLSDYEGIDGEGVEQGEGTVLPCKHCSSSLVVRDGKWEWNQSSRRPSSERDKEYGDQLRREFGDGASDL